MNFTSFDNIKKENVTKTEETVDTTFKKDTLVTLKKEYEDYSIEHKSLYGVALQVEICKTVNLGDMVVEVLYLYSTDNEKKELIHNPYLSKFFKISA